MIQFDKAEFAREARRPQSGPPGHGRGISIAADGDRYSESLYVLLRLLRHLGCRLPAQIWHNADKPLPAAVAAEVGQLNAVCRPLIERPLNDDTAGNPIKALQVMDSPWREVIYLDADCYPVRDPEEVFDWPEYRTTGAVFWPNFRVCDPLEWAAFGMEAPAEPQFEGGVYVVDKARHGRSLALTDWLLQRQPSLHPVIRGDEECFHAAWRATGGRYAMPATGPGWSVHTILDHDFAGQPFIQHRIQDKFRVKNYRFRSEHRGGAMIFNGKLAHERECFDFLADYRRMAG